ncbi:MAG: GIY-YIG nuclease family protein [Candidatus Pacebacteria bacterium]|nr:GIY-YIG nuclease family protein [Candidatus Paceibacterota bacterium]
MNSVYILKCADGTLYTGSTLDVKKREHEHNELKSGAKYTRARRPVKLVYSERCKNYAKAREREAEIKRMERNEKLQLIKDQK